MRTFSTLLAVGILALAAGCGGSSSSGIDGGGGTAGAFGAPGGTGAGGISGNGGAGVAGAGGGGVSGSCNMPSCLANLPTTCTPSGTCVEQTTTTGTNDCYSNGVKVITTIDLSTFNSTETFKNGSTTCYSIAVSGLLTGTPTFTLKNAAGATIGTGTEDATTNAVTFTCTGQSPVVLNSSCDTSSFAGSSAGSCNTPGTCSP
jgi:hypothetical protein